MTNLNDNQRSEIVSIISKCANSEELTGNQRWEVAKVIARVAGIASAVLLPIFALLVGAAYYFLKSVAEEVSEEITTQKIASIEIPPGAVVAFDIDTGCPTDMGWSTYALAQGRMIAGVLADGDNLDETLKPLIFHSKGGAVSHTLIEDELPSHSHSLTSMINSGVSVSSGQGQGGFQQAQSLSSITGNNLPHENMPPYLALHYCIKLGLLKKQSE